MTSLVTRLYQTMLRRTTGGADSAAASGDGGESGTLRLDIETAGALAPTPGGGPFGGGGLFGGAPVLSTPPVFDGGIFGGGIDAAGWRSIETLFLLAEDVGDGGGGGSGGGDLPPWMAVPSSLEPPVIFDENFFAMALFYALNTYGRSRPRVGDNFALWATVGRRYRQRYIVINGGGGAAAGSSGNGGGGGGLRMAMQWRADETNDAYTYAWWLALLRGLRLFTERLKPGDWLSTDEACTRWAALGVEQRADLLMYYALQWYHQRLHLPSAAPTSLSAAPLTYGTPVMFSVCVHVALDAATAGTGGGTVGQQYRAFADAGFDALRALDGVYVVDTVEFTGVVTRRATTDLVVEVLLPDGVGVGVGGGAPRPVWSTQSYDPSLAVAVARTSNVVGGAAFWTTEHSMLVDDDNGADGGGGGPVRAFLNRRWHGGVNIDPMALNDFAARHPRAHDMVPWFLLDHGYVTGDVDALRSVGVTEHQHGPVGHGAAADGIVVEVLVDSAAVVPWLQFLIALSAAVNGWLENGCVLFGARLAVAEDQYSMPYDRARAARLRSAYDRIDAAARTAGTCPEGIGALCAAVHTQATTALGAACYVMRRSVLAAAVDLLAYERRRTLTLLNVCRLADIGVRVAPPFNINADAWRFAPADALQSVRQPSAGDFEEDAAANVNRTRAETPALGGDGGGGGGGAEVEVAFNVYGRFLRNTATDAARTPLEEEYRSIHAQRYTRQQRMLPPSSSSLSSASMVTTGIPLSAAAVVVASASRPV